MDGICDVDVDANGINDIDDLAANLNPNDDTELCDLPVYGGASRIEPKGNLDDYGIFLGAFAAVALLLLRTRRRRPTGMAGR